MHRIKSLLPRIGSVLWQAVYFIANATSLFWAGYRLITDWLTSKFTQQYFFVPTGPNFGRMRPPPEFSIYEYREVLILSAFVLISLTGMILPFCTKKFSGLKGTALYFFVVEIPVVLLLGIGILTGSQNHFSNLLLQLVLIILASPSITLILSFHKEKISKMRASIYFIVQTVLVTVISYGFLLYSFIVIPMIVLFANSYLVKPIEQYSNPQLLRYGTYSSTSSDIFMYFLIAIPVVLIGIGTLTVLPYTLIHWTIRRTKIFYGALVENFSLEIARFSLLGIVLATLVFGIFFTRPPQFKHLHLFSEYAVISQSQNDPKKFEKLQAIARDLQENATAAKAELRFLETAEERYPFDKDFSITRGLRDFYDDFLKMPARERIFIDQLFRIVAYPLVLPVENLGYDSQYHQAAEAVLGYNVYDGTDIVYSKPQRSFPVVYSTEREVAITTQQENRLALVTVTDSFRNESSSDQETTAEFLLPTGSIIVDLKLGQNLEFPGIVAPRGAARATYEAELQQRRDPALLQQIGPDQYRLRVFPVPASGKQKVQFSYITTVTPQGYGLPHYTLERNYTSVTGSPLIPKVLVNGALVNLPVTDSFVKSEVDFCDLQDGSLGAGNQSFVIANTPSRIYHCSLPNQKLSFTEPVGKKIAIMLDVSISNKGLQAHKQLQEFFAVNLQLLENNTVELYQLNSDISQPITITPQNYARSLDAVVWFGSGSFTKMLSATPTDADAVFFITNSTTNSVLENGSEKFKMLPDLYLVYPEFKTAPDWDPTVTDSLFNKHVTASPDFTEAWLSFVTTESKTTQETVINPYWRVVSVESKTMLGELLTGSFSTTTLNADFPEIFRAYQKLRSEMGISAQGINLSNPSESDLAILDGFTTQAEQLHVVTPLTSMIALVNQTQLERLEHNKKTDNRYSDWSNQTDMRTWREFSSSGRGITNTAIGTAQPGAGWNSNGVFDSFSTPKNGLSAARNTPTAAEIGLDSLSNAKQLDDNMPQEEQQNNSFGFIGSTVVLVILIGCSLIIFYKRRKLKTSPFK